MEKLLITGGAVDPRKGLVAEENKFLESFLAPFGRTVGEGATPIDNPHFRFEWPSPYYPFKNRPVHHHRATQTSVMGLAELILEQEAAAVGVPSRIMAMDEIVDIQGRLKDPTLFDDYSLMAVSTTYIPPLLILLLLRNIPDHVKVFIGGPGAFKVKEHELRRIKFAYFLRSEAEGRFRRLLQHARGEEVDLSEIPGLTWRVDQQLFHSTEPYTYIDLNAASLPDLKKMAYAQEGRVVYESARGCPFRCAFCDYPFLMGNNKFRYKSAERIHDDWRVMHDSMGVKDILCLDSLFTYPPERLKQFCRLLCESGLNKALRWGCYARPDDMARSGTAEMMHEAGCEYLYLGFESGSQRVLEYMNKKCTVEENRKALLNCLHAGIMTVGLFIAGFPGETRELFQETRDFLHDTPPFITSVVPWTPDFADDSRVPVMQPNSVREFQLRIEYPTMKKVTLWRSCSFRAPLSIYWGSYWTHRGMDLQEAWDCISEVIQDIHDGNIRTLSEDYFLPRLLDDPLNLYRQLGPSRAVDLCSGLSRLILDGRKNEFYEWCRGIGLRG